MKKEIYLAGGCFWGLQQYLKNIPGVISTEVGYANGKTSSPTYEQVCHDHTGHAETVKVVYDNSRLSLKFLLKTFYDVIDPLSLNRQGNDIGEQYRTGIYYTELTDQFIVEASLSDLQKKFNQPITIEAAALSNYTSAEDTHQDYLEQHPQGYCHINPQWFKKAKIAIDPSKAFPIVSLEKLTPLQYAVTQEAGTEPPFNNEYNTQFEPGIYVDVTSGEPLFYSTDKFESGCGWPAFSKPISQHLISEKQDYGHNMKRIEVRSAHSNAHLGHVFTDGPKQQGGLRYCINSAALKFIPQKDMQAKGYGAYLVLLEK